MVGESEDRLRTFYNEDKTFPKVRRSKTQIEEWSTKNSVPVIILSLGCVTSYFEENKSVTLLPRGFSEEDSMNLITTK